MSRTIEVLPLYAGGAVSPGQTARAIVISFPGPPGRDGADGNDGQDGQDGTPGLNEVTTATATDINGYFKGNGSKVGAVSKIPSSDLDSTNFSITSGATTFVISSTGISANADDYTGGVDIGASSVTLYGEYGIQVQNAVRYDPGYNYLFSTTVNYLSLSKKAIEFLRDDFIGTQNVTIHGIDTSSIFNVAPVKIINTGTSTYTFKNQSATVGVSSRFKCVTNADIQLKPGEQLEIFYNYEQFNPIASRCLVFLPVRSGVEIGGTIGGATANRMLYVGTGPTLAESNVFWQSTTGPDESIGRKLIVRRDGSNDPDKEVRISYHPSENRAIICPKTGSVTIGGDRQYAGRFDYDIDGGAFSASGNIASNNGSFITSGNPGFMLTSANVISFSISGNVWDARDTTVGRRSFNSVGIYGDLGKSTEGFLESLLRPLKISDAAAPNDCQYYSTTQNKMVYKDSGGTIYPYY